MKGFCEIKMRVISFFSHESDEKPSQPYILLKNLFLLSFHKIIRIWKNIDGHDYML